MTDTTEPGAPAFDLFAGTPFRFARLISDAGGMGSIYEVEHIELRKRFAAKVLKEEFAGDAALLDRVRVEAQTLARLDHPNIVSVTSIGNLRDGRPYIVMELLRGHTLGAELKQRGKLPIHEATGWTRKLLSALAEAHALGVVHRDVKLENLFLHDPGSGRPVLKLLDFGIVKILQGVSSRTPQPPSMPTEEGVIVGTPRFMSPEAARATPVDPRADIYCAGIVLYALLTGKDPYFDREGAAGLIAAHAWEPARPPSVVADKPDPFDPFPSELDTVVMCALAKNPARRYQTAKEFDAALEEVELLMRSGTLRTATVDPELIRAQLMGKSSPARSAADTERTAPERLPAAVHTSPRESTLRSAESAGTSAQLPSSGASSAQEVRAPEPSKMDASSSSIEAAPNRGAAASSSMPAEAVKPGGEKDERPPLGSGFVVLMVIVVACAVLGIAGAIAMLFT